MIGGQRPKPAALRVIQGNPGRRPINPEPQSPPLGPPPRHLDADHRRVWRELAGKAPIGVLKRADEPLLEMAVALFLRFRASPLSASPSMMAQLRQCLAELGCGPSARARLSVAPPPTADPFDGI
jgi:phage terminase small subunit